MTNETWRAGATCDIRGWHFQARLYERYGIVLEPGEFSAIVKAIAEGRGMLLRPQVYAVEFRSAVIVVVSDGKKLVTALGADMRPSKAPKKKRGPRHMSQWRWVGHDVRFGEYA